MKNKITLYMVLIVVSVIFGAGGYSLIFNNSSQDVHNHEDEETLYSCGMHPNIIESDPGTCPICGMNLTPIKSSQKNELKGPKNRKIIYWRAPMNPNEIYDAPGKSQMGMDLVPVYEDDGDASGVVTVDGSVLQSMNVKMEFVKSKNLASIIYTNSTLETDERKEFALTTKIDGWIEKLYINYTGQKVSKGQKLVDIYSPELVAAQQELLTALNYQVFVDQQSVVSRIVSWNTLWIWSLGEIWGESIGWEPIWWEIDYISKIQPFERLWDQWVLYEGWTRAEIEISSISQTQDFIIDMLWLMVEQTRNVDIQNKW